MSFYIASILISVLLTLVGFPQWFIAGCKSPWRYRIVERNDGWCHVESRLFWWPFWFIYRNRDCNILYMNKVGAETYIQKELQQYLAKQTKAKHYYPQHSTPVSKTEIQIP